MQAMTTEQLRTHLQAYPSRRAFCRELIDRMQLPHSLETVEQTLSRQLRTGRIGASWVGIYTAFFNLKKSE